ncbi:MAG TPA: mechanosensitive ion channel domain-containing protein [Byssovorax sp.]|jgi:small-conductance mechanosensitive channel
MDPDAAKDLSIADTIHVGGVLTGLVILAITVFAVRVASGSLSRLGDRFAHRRLALNQIATLVRFVLYLGGIAAAVAASVRLSKEVVLGLTGTLAVTIGFALKDLAASVLAGIIIIFDKPFQVGDRVSFGGQYGEIEAIGLRSVRLVTLDDNVVTIPNNKFLTELVASGNWGALDMLIQMDFFVGADQPLALAKRLVEDALTSNRYVYLGKPWSVLVNQVVHENYFALRLRAKAYVLDVKYEKAFETDVTERIVEAFARHGILPPAILHRTLAATVERAP